MNLRAYGWCLAAVNASVVAVAILVAVSWASGWEFYPLYVLVAIPFAGVAGWRTLGFVRQVMRVEEKPLRPAIEGFLLMFGATVMYLVPNILRAHLAGVEPVGWDLEFWTMAVGYTLFYSVPAGLAGALLGFGMGTFTILVLELWPPRHARVPNDQNQP